MLAIEIALYKGWYNLQLEADSKLVILAISFINTVPWNLRNSCMHLIRNMNFIISHILRE